MRTVLPSLLIGWTAAVALAVSLLPSCAAPGVAVNPQPGDFAFLEINLRG